jgi:aspartyl-tRNA synthetase
MSFVEQDDVFDVVENFLIDMTKDITDKEILTETP